MNIIIYNQKIAGKLMEKGHNLLEVKVNKNNPNFNVFFFKKTELLKKDMEEIIKNGK